MFEPPPSSRFSIELEAQSLKSFRRGFKFAGFSSTPSLVSVQSLEERPRSLSRGFFGGYPRERKSKPSRLVKDIRPLNLDLPPVNGEAQGGERSPFEGSLTPKSEDLSSIPAKNNFLKRLTIKLTSSTSKHTPLVIPPCAVSNNGTKARHIAALHANGLVTRHDFSAQQHEQDQIHLPVVPKSLPSNGPTAAMLIRQEWGQNLSHNEEFVTKERLKSFRFGSPLASPVTPSFQDISFPSSTDSLDTFTISPTLSTGTTIQPFEVVENLATTIPLPPSPHIDETVNTTPWAVPLPPSPASSCVVWEAASVPQPRITIELSPPSRRNSDAESTLAVPITLLSISEQSSSFENLNTDTEEEVPFAPLLTDEPSPTKDDFFFEDPPCIIEVASPVLCSRGPEFPSPPTSRSRRKFPNPFRRSQTAESSTTSGQNSKTSRKSIFRRSTAGNIPIDCRPRVIPPLPCASPQTSFNDHYSVGRRSVEGSITPVSSRLPACPTMHNRGSIVNEAMYIPDEESRRVTELAFLG